MSARGEQVIELPVAAVNRLPSTPLSQSASRSGALSRTERWQQAMHALQSLRHWLPQLRYRLVKVGPAALAGGSAVLMSMLAVVLVALPAHRAELALRAQLSHPLQVAGPAGAANLSEQLLISMPDRAQVPGILAQMLTEAGSVGVALDQGHYDFRPPQAGSLGRYSFEFPLKGPYANVREFIDRTLTAMPSVALEKLRIERRTIGDNVINANVTFTVFVRGE